MRDIARERILRRDGGKCGYCGSTDNLEVDHIIPLSKGGSHSEDNFQTLCRPCNRKKKDSNAFPELLKKYVILTESPEYFLFSRDFPIGSMKPKIFSQFTQYAFDEHAKLFGLR
jgi:hypothetical protein